MELKKVIDDIIELPTLPEVATTLIRLIDDPDSSASDLNDVLISDVSLSAKILKLVNSPFYGFRDPVGSLKQAIVILGFRTIRSLAISTSVMDLFSIVEMDGFTQEDFWIHSVGVATASNLIANYMDDVPNDAAFVCGLMHDMGKLLINQHADSIFKEILLFAKENNLCFHDAEEKLYLDINHSEIGFMLAEKWNLPENIKIVLRDHHKEPIGTDEPILIAIIQLANHVCEFLKIGSGGNFGPIVPNHEQCVNLLKGVKVPEILDTLRESIDKIRAMTNL